MPAKHLVSWLRVDLNGRLIGHRSRWKKQGGFVPKHVRDPFLKGIHRGVLCENIVASRRGRHCGDHRGSRTGDRVGTQIDSSLGVVAHGDKVILRVN